MEDRLQHQPTAHEPQRAHTNRVRSTPQGGAKLEQILLMSEGKSGSRSKSFQLHIGPETACKTIAVGFSQSSEPRRSILTSNLSINVSTSIVEASLAFL